MHAALSSETRLSDGRFAPGHSGNPAGRPKGSKGLGTRLVAALREGEDEIILRTVIEAALMGDKVAARFCAGRIDAAAREGDSGADLFPPPPGIAPADALNPFYLHAKLVQAVIEGTLPPERALDILRVAAAKRQLTRYEHSQLDDEEFAELGGTFVEAEEEAEEDEDEQDEESEEEEAEDEEDEEEAALNPPPLAGEGGARAAAGEGDQGAALPARACYSPVSAGIAI